MELIKIKTIETKGRADPQPGNLRKTAVNFLTLQENKRSCVKLPKLPLTMLPSENSEKLLSHKNKQQISYYMKKRKEGAE